MIEFKLPSLGADMDEGKLLEWKIAPGDTVRRGDVVAIVDTSKAAVDVESWDAGIVHELRVQPGETVPVGTVLATLLAPGEAAPAPEAITPRATAAPAPATDASPALQMPAAAAPPAPAAATSVSARQRVSPAARKRAAELGIALDEIRGGGPQGTITLEDIAAAAAATAAAPKGTVASAPDATSPDDRAEAMRRAMAAAMSRSKREIPHYYLGHTVPLAAATTWLASYNAARPVTERVLMAALLVRAVALACRRHPVMNGFCRDGVFIPSTAIHVGIAIALRGGGLVAPAILDADRLPVGELMAALADLVKRSRAGSLRSSEMGSSTITVTNLGDVGVDSVFGVIYPPQVALVGFGAVHEQPVASDGTVAALPCVTASIAGDHRVSSGHQGALFLAEIARLLQQPDLP